MVTFEPDQQESIDGKDRSGPHFERMRAKQKGLKRYFTGKPCPKGHVSDRMVVNGRCCQCMKEYKLRPENISRELIRLKKAREKYPDKHREKDRKAYYKDIEKTRERSRARAALKKINKLPKRYYLTEIQKKINNSMRCGIYRSLKEKKAGQSWEKLVGYDLKTLVNHLERQFSAGMSWENYGEWEIDHIVPVSYFNFTSNDCDEFRFCYGLHNLRPLWKKSNRKKWDKREFLL